MKEWRPDNWGDIKRQHLATGECDSEGAYDDDYTAGFEVGADAMLEALFQLAKESPTETFTIDSRIVYIYEEDE